ncbi:hypothetical protein NEMIN01_2494, partial [Nematocida minor]|uniref:uncharacterized protein n=1 Tax=Nematocida minor TaxID=1912983 RepID=UPI00221FC3F4
MTEVKKVKLNIDVMGMMKACETLVNECNSYFKSGISNNSMIPIDHLFKDNITLESDSYNDTEKEMLLGVLKNNAYQYFSHNGGGVDVLAELIDALKNGKNEKNDEVSSKSISLINQFIKPNSLIYRPELGIYRQVNMNEAPEDINQPSGNIDHIDLSARTYTLEIDDAKFLSLADMLDYTTESRNREFLSYTASVMKSEYININILKGYLPKNEKYYTLDELYDNKHDKTSEALVDYGLKLIQENYKEIKSLIKIIEEKSDDSFIRALQDKKFKSIFSAEGDLKIALSIAENIGMISNEKNAHKCMASAIEYMVDNNVSLLKEKKDGPNVLMIENDLSNIAKDYIHGDNLLEGMIDAKKTELAKTKGVLKDSVQAIEQENSEEGANNVKSVSNNLKNQIYSLECDEKKEETQSRNIGENKSYFF